MANHNCSFVRSSFNTATLERERKVYAGMITKIDHLHKEYQYAFKIEDSILRMVVKTADDKLEIEQVFSDSTSNMTFINGKEGYYSLRLNNGYQLDFITQTSLLKIMDFNINLKYNLIDKQTKEIISLNEIEIKGEEVC